MLPCASASIRCGAFPSLPFAPRTALPSMAAGRAQPGQPGQHVRPGICGPLPDRGERPRPAITAAMPKANATASGCRRPRRFRGSGTWARRSRRYWLRAAGMNEDVIGGRVSLEADAGERRNSHRSARALPVTRRNAGHVTHCHDIAGRSLTSRLCRVPVARCLRGLSPASPRVQDRALLHGRPRSGDRHSRLRQDPLNPGRPRRKATSAVVSGGRTVARCRRASHAGLPPLR
jgi:hypothetical protein